MLNQLIEPVACRENGEKFLKKLKKFKLYFQFFEFFFYVPQRSELKGVSYGTQRCIL